MHGVHGVQEQPGVRVPVAKVAELAAVLDPATQAAQAVALNLKLMRWRAAPALDLDAVAATRCLILGVPQHVTPAHVDPSIWPLWRMPAPGLCAVRAGGIRDALPAQPQRNYLCTFILISRWQLSARFMHA